MRKKLFVANWKMNKSLTASLDFCTIHKTSLEKLTNHAEVVLCPSFPALFSMFQMIKNTKIRLGAQTCSSHEKGPYTGQVNAQSLKEVGCHYCIIGHSEQRRDAHLTNEDIAKQATRLLDVGIEPIICIGESKETFMNHTTKAVLEHQLHPVLKAIQSFNQPVTIAYEPIWAIGTGIIPEDAYIQDIFIWLTHILQEKLQSTWRLLYGGSVNPDTIMSFKTVTHLDGFLIGDASLNFQKFEKIVS